MVMCRQNVRTPEDDQFRETERLRIHPDAVVAKRVARADSACDGADGDEMSRRAQHVPQASPAAVDPLNEPHVAGADVGPDRFRTARVDDAAETCGDDV